MHGRQSGRHSPASDLLVRVVTKSTAMAACGLPVRPPREGIRHD
jgi:hypothetical protein